MADRRGFTLAETMVVIAIIGIMAGIGGAYLLTQLPTIRVNGAARQLVGDLRLAKSMAIEQGKRTFVAFDPMTATYILYLDDGDDAFNPVDETQVKQVALASLYRGIAYPDYSSVLGNNPNGDPLPTDGISFSGNRAMFDPAGTALGGGVYVHPAKDAGVRRDRERVVMITGTTGRARVYRYDGSSWD